MLRNGLCRASRNLGGSGGLRGLLPPLSRDSHAVFQTLMAAICLFDTFHKYSMAGPELVSFPHISVLPAARATVTLTCTLAHFRMCPAPGPALPHPHALIGTWARTHTNAHSHKHAYAYTHSKKHICMHTLIEACTHTLQEACTHTHMHTFTEAGTRAHARTHTSTHVYSQSTLSHPGANCLHRPPAHNLTQFYTCTVGLLFIATWSFLCLYVCLPFTELGCHRSLE